MPEARIEETPAGLVAADDGWFVLNVGEIAWDAQPAGWPGRPGGGTWCTFEAPSAPSAELGIGVHVLQPGETSGLYHAESDQEGFLVLSGEALLLVEGRERPLRRWDYFHCPAGVPHITVGAGDGPCAILMVGARSADHSIVYPVDETAARHGASATVETTDAAVAYAGRPAPEPARSPWAAIVGEDREDRADLERQVRVLSGALGIALPDPSLLEAVARLAREGRAVEAIRDLRRGVDGKIGLVAAKRMVDALVAERPGGHVG